MAKDETKGVLIRYGRRQDVVVFKTENVDEHELRAYIVALWSLLEQRSRLDTIRELAHYHESPSARLPPVADALSAAYAKEQPR